MSRSTILLLFLRFYTFYTRDGNSWNRGLKSLILTRSFTHSILKYQ